LLAAATVLAACADSAWAIDVGQARWGFDGQATSHHFNLLSVLISNSGPEPFEGTLELRESIGGGTRVGAPLVEDIYIAPFSSRWVQFYPYVKERFEDWSLRWKDRNGQPIGGQSVVVPQPVLGNQTPVWLVGADELSGHSGALRHFPENLFPPMVTATDTLKTIALDHVPQWEEARRQSFYDWLFRGGQLHLFKDVNGSYPQFSAGLAELNAPAEQFQIGAGRVFRHNRPRSQIDSDFVAKNLGVTANAQDPASSQNEDVIEIGGKRSRSSIRVAHGVRPDGEPADALFADLTGGLFAFLKALTRPHHNWALIYSMAIFYVLTVIPGVHILGRKRFDYRLVYGALIGLIVLFSLGFAYIGRRGHDEANTVNAVAVARQLPDGALDVTAWSNVFVINGGDYAISRAGTGSLISTAQSFEAVNGVIRNGAQGVFYVDIPPYSSQPFLHRLKLKNDRFEIKVNDFATAPLSSEPDAVLTKLVLVTDSHFPRPATRDFVYALYRDQVYEMTWADGRLELHRPRAQSLSQFLGSIHSEDLSPYSRGYVSPRPSNSRANSTPPFETLQRPLIAWSLGLKRRSDIPTFVFPSDRVRLFVWAELPESLRVNDPRMGSQQGRMLYVVDVLKPVKP